MNIIFVIVLFYSLVVSTITSIWFVNKRGSKKFSLSIAFLVNLLFLSVATMVLYKMDTQTFHKQTEGWFESLGIVVLLFFVPILTYINYFLIRASFRKV